MKRFKNILISVDAPADVHPALDWAVQLAEHSGAKLKMVDVLPDFPAHTRLAMRDYEHVHELLLQEKQTLLEELAARVRRRGIKITTRVLCGQTSVEIVREVLRDDHDLVVRVSKGPHSRRTGFFGTTSYRLLRKCPCPVWIVKPDKEASFTNILAAVDSRAHDNEHAALNGDIIELARSIAETQRGRFHIMHAWSIFGEDVLRARMDPEEFRALERTTRQEAEQALEALLAEYGLEARDQNVHLVKGEPAVAIPEFVETNGIDLLVIGTVGRSGISGFIMGNTAELILDRVHCAVLALKPAGFVSPIKLEKNLCTS